MVSQKEKREAAPEIPRWSTSKIVGGGLRSRSCRMALTSRETAERSCDDETKGQTNTQSEGDTVSYLGEHYYGIVHPRIHDNIGDLVLRFWTPRVKV